MEGGAGGNTASYERYRRIQGDRMMVGYLSPDELRDVMICLRRYEPEELENYRRG